VSAAAASDRTVRCFIPSSTSSRDRCKATFLAPSVVEHGMLTVQRHTQDSYIVYVEVPGFKKESLGVSLDNDRLTITGSSETDYGEGAKVRVGERAFGSFSRSIRVPQSLKPEDVRASAENGILRVELPKNAPQAPKQQIAIA
jgi:HSP20 family molecular chaperone IbpA